MVGTGHCERGSPSYKAPLTHGELRGKLTWCVMSSGQRVVALTYIGMMSAFGLVFPSALSNVKLFKSSELNHGNFAADALASKLLHSSAVDCWALTYLRYFSVACDT